MSYQRTIKIEDEHFQTYFHEIDVSCQPRAMVKLLNQHSEIEKYGADFAENKAYGKGVYENKCYKRAVGESSNRTVAAAKINQGNFLPRKHKLGPELELFPPEYVLVGCTSCYTYMMVSSSNSACLICRKRARTVEELNMKKAKK